MADIYYVFSISQLGTTIIMIALCAAFLAVLGFVRSKGK